MAYHLKTGERVPDGIRRTAREELESAANQLEGRAGATRDEAIHEARKSIKKVRGVLRLMRPELGETYGAESARLDFIGQVKDAMAAEGITVR